MKWLNWLAAPALLAALAGPAPAQVEVKWKFKEGDTFYLEESVANKQTVRVGESLNRQELNQTRVSRVKVLKVLPDGGAVLEIKVESVKAASQGGSAEAEEKVVKRLEGTVLTVTLNAGGRVVALEGYDKMLAAMAGGDERTEEVLKQVMSRKTVEAPLDLLFGLAPGKAVGKGDAWQLKADAPFALLGTLHLAHTIKVEEARKEAPDGVRLALATAVTFTPAAGGGGVKVESGDVKPKEAGGTAVFDAAAGRLSKLETRRVLVGQFTVRVNEQAALPMTVEQQQTLTVRVHDRNPLQK
jgi:hypothetical protein